MQKLLIIDYLVIKLNFIAVF